MQCFHEREEPHTKRWGNLFLFREVNSPGRKNREKAGTFFHLPPGEDVITGALRATECTGKAASSDLQAPRPSFSFLSFLVFLFEVYLT